MSRLTFPFVLHYVNHDGGVQQHHEIHDLRELHRELMNLPRLSLTDAENITEAILRGETVDLTAFRLDAVVWGTQESSS